MRSEKYHFLWMQESSERYSQQCASVKQVSRSHVKFDPMNDKSQKQPPTYHRTKTLAVFNGLALIDSFLCDSTDVK